MVNLSLLCSNCMDMFFVSVSSAAHNCNGVTYAYTISPGLPTFCEDLKMYMGYYSFRTFLHYECDGSFMAARP